ncbi:LysR family transcriptional regulator [Aquibaculum arenosum]|uniref:LysR family transcriptional regulator n=1 Tax=Aquibaculum arenosum TaxID=3032591 RepID=A0ABT5YND2_9PROT|nr:LysR family transcriptional regulator [Fodinicurvata sp. CAU 1616]MDF2096250.1 LysR family transcriptional regulator [Fodinicurvata sp. CAU 1616]
MPDIALGYEGGVQGQETSGESIPERLSRELDWNLLHTFMVIVQEGSITRAADRLLLRQPSVSNALKRLEAQLERRLINRSRGRFQLTESGRLLYGECVEIYGSVSRLAVMLRDSRETVAGEISIAAASHVVCPFYDQVLSGFQAAHPQTSFSVEISTSSLVQHAVLQKSAALGFCLVSDPSPRLNYEHFFREHFGFFCGPSHRLFGRRGLSLTALRGEAFVSFKTDQLSDALRPVALLRERAGLGGRIVATSSHLEEVRRMIVAGLGIGPLPIHVVEKDVRDGLLWRLPPYEEPPAIDIYLVTNPRMHHSRAESLFLQSLRQRITSLPLSARTYPPL